MQAAGARTNGAARDEMRKLIEQVKSKGLRQRSP
jgi:hypothetical protein